MSSVGIDAIAKELAEKANECCYRSDGYEEKMRDAILLALREVWQAAAAAEREACAKLIANDADAISYQSMGQYRTAMIQAIRRRGEG